MKVFLHKQELWILAILLLSLILTSYLPSVSINGYSLFLGRIIVPILSVIIFGSIWNRGLKKNISTYFIGIVGITILYGGLSLIWSNDIVEGIKVLLGWIMLALISIILYGLTVISGENTARFTDHFMRVLKTIFIVVLMFAGYEVLTGSHLNGSYTKFLMDLKPFHAANRVPVVVFGNPNNLAVFVSLVAALFMVFEQDSKWQLTGLIGAIGIAVITDSKIALLAGMLMLLVYVKDKLNKPTWVLSIITLGMFGTAILWTGEDNQNAQNFKDLKAGKFIEGPIYMDSVKPETTVNALMIREKNIEDSIYVSSGASRKQLFLAGFDVLKSSSFLGVGVGQFEVEIKRQGKEREVGGIVNPHSFILRTFTEFGWLALLWIIAVLGLVRTFWKSALTNSEKSRHLVCLLVILLLSNGPSSFIQLTWAWALIVFWIVVLSKTIEQRGYAKKRAA